MRLCMQIQRESSRLRTADGRSLSTNTRTTAALELVDDACAVHTEWSFQPYRTYLTFLAFFSLWFRCESRNLFLRA